MLKRKYFYLFILLMIGTGCFGVYASFSPSILHGIANNTSNQSKLYEFSMIRILKIYANNPEEVISVIKKENGNNRSSYTDLILMAVIAKENLLEIIDDRVNNLEDVEEQIYSKADVSLLVELVGIGMMTNKVELLENLLNELNKKEAISNIHYAINFIVARTLFFLTGKKYTYRGVTGDQATVQPTSDILKVREILVQSQGRERTTEEMITLFKYTTP